MNFTGLIIGVCTFLIIGLLHPVVIKSEYYFGVKVWPIFLVLGIGCVASAVFIHHIIISTLLSVLGFSLLWSIHELFEQKERVKKGWFPKNSKRQDYE